MAVRCVAQEQDPSHPERRGEDGVDRPAGHLLDLHGQILDAEGPAHVGLHLLVGLGPGVVDRIVEVDHPLLRGRAPMLGAHGDHDHQGSGLRGEDPADQHVGVRRPSREVGRHVQRGRLRHHAQALVLDAHEAGDDPSPIRAQQVLAGHHIGVAGGDVPHQGPDALVVLFQVEQLVSEADPPRRQCLRPRLEQGLEPDLGKVHLPARAGQAPVLVSSARAPALQLGQPPSVIGLGSVEAGVVGGRRHVVGRGAALLDRVGHPDIVEHLHRPLVQHVSLGQVGGLGAGAHEQMLDSVGGEQHGGGQPRAPSAHDEHGDLHVGRVVE